MQDKEFWVMGGYGESRTVADMFPFDEFYNDVIVMKLKEGAKWAQVEDIWEEGEMTRLGKIVVVDDCDKGCPSIFMLDGCDIFRIVDICMEYLDWHRTRGSFIKADNFMSLWHVK